MLDNLLPFLAFVVAVTASPGPGNLAHMAIGQTFGVRAAFPFWLGAVLGVLALTTLAAAGLGRIIVASPQVNTVLKFVGMGYIIYLAVRIVRSQMAQAAEAKRFRFAEGLLVHPLNPKTWAASLAALTQFIDPAAPLLPQWVVFVAGISGGLALFHGLWCVAGAFLLRLLRSERVRLAFNVTMAATMVLATAGAML